jgi:integrase
MITAGRGSRKPPVSRGLLVWAHQVSNLGPLPVLRNAAARAGLVQHWETWCRKCVELGRPVLHEVRRTNPAGSVCLRHDAPVKLWVHPVPLPIRFHDLRHGLGTNLVKAGVPLPHVQRILRHASIRTTVDIYSHLASEDLRASVEAPTRQGGKP